jgi:glycosyltransferase involved in cell wall biosynthesis
VGAIHQFVAGYTNHDAISNEARVLRDIFKKWGHASEIYCQHQSTLAQLRKDAREVTLAPDEIKKDDLVLLHLSMGSEANQVFRRLDCRRALLYHNVTPPKYFSAISRSTAVNLERGVREVAELAGSAECNIADSHFNASELEALGYTDVHVLPLVLDLDNLTSNPSRRIMRVYDDDKTTVIFVGRCAPNKKIEDVLTAFAYFQKYVEPHSRLIHVGSFAGTERYYYVLETMAREMGLNDVHFFGSIPQDELNAVFKCADLFLCMSEHEGFCIPLIESLIHDVPVLAYAAAAVPETLDGAGVLCHEKNWEMIAEMMGRMIKDLTFREALIKRQRERIEQFRQRDPEKEIRSILKNILPAPR